MPTTDIVKVLLADDHEVLRKGVRRLLEDHDRYCVVGEASTGQEALALYATTLPDVVIMDVSMPTMDGVMATRRLLKKFPKARVIALSMYENRQAISRMIDAGAQGFISKSGVFDELIDAIEDVIVGEAYISRRLAGAVLKQARAVANPKESELTVREYEVLKVLAEGSNTKEAASLLGVSTKTIEVHRKNIMDKSGVKTIAKLTHLAIREGIVELA